MATIPSLPLFTSGPAKSGQFNRLRDAIAFWQNPPAAMVTQTSNQSISNATWTLLTFGSTSYDTDSIVTSSSRFTIQTPGRYSIVGKVVYASSATGRRWIAIRKNSTGSYVTGTLLYATNIAATSAADHVIIPPGPEFQMSAGDTLEAFTFQDSGGSLNTAASGSDVHMAVRLVQSTATTSGDEGTTLPGALVQTLLGTADLNSVTTPGNYLQDTSVNATAGRNYPIVRAGHLEVHGGASSNFVMQRYTEYDDSIARDVWVRTKYVATWGAWQLIAPVSAGGGASRNWIPGTWCLPGSNLKATTSNEATSAATLYVVPFVAAGPGTVTDIAINVQTAAGAGNAARLGIYKQNATGAGWTLVNDAGTVAIDSTGQKTLSSLSIALDASGVYGIAVLPQAACTLTCQGADPGLAGLQTPFTTSARVFLSVAQAYGALPSSASPVPGGGFSSAFHRALVKLA